MLNTMFHRFIVSSSNRMVLKVIKHFDYIPQNVNGIAYL